eukprot:2153911-Rhodomonas_salina.1
MEPHTLGGSLLGRQTRNQERNQQKPCHRPCAGARGRKRVAPCVSAALPAARSRGQHATCQSTRDRMDPSVAGARR